MTVYDLSREQLRQLKQRHLMEQGASLSWGRTSLVDRQGRCRAWKRTI